MDTISFDKLILKTAFCCMAADGHIDNREVKIIKSLCESSPLFNGFNFQDEINKLVVKMNERGTEFIEYYFGLLEKSNLSTEEELSLIDFAVHTIKADDHMDYAEIKFFKNIRHRLKVSDDEILERYPDIEIFLEEDIDTGMNLKKMMNQYLDSVSMPHFVMISVDLDVNDIN